MKLKIKALNKAKDNTIDSAISGYQETIDQIADRFSELADEMSRHIRPVIEDHGTNISE